VVDRSTLSNGCISRLKEVGVCTVVGRTVGRVRFNRCSI